MITHQTRIQQQDLFLKEWPLERLKLMTLEDYTNLDKESSFIYWLESKTQDAGSIWGGSAFKFGIYRRKNTESWTNRKMSQTDGIYGWLTKYGNSAQEAFDKIKNIIISIAEASIKNDLDPIEAIDLGTVVKWKIASLYNSEIIPVFKKEALEMAAYDYGYNDATHAKVSDLQKFLQRHIPSNQDAMSFAETLWTKYMNDEMLPNIERFIAQSHTKNLKRQGYPKTYQGYNVKVSFGTGNIAKIPWMAFLSKLDTVQDGIYPVYLHYKDIRLLILAYGISETNTPERSWVGINAETIEEYLIRIGHGPPEHYGNSLVYKIYSTKDQLDEKAINNDLDSILAEYGKTLTRTNKRSEAPELLEELKYLSFVESLKSAGLFFNSLVCLRFVSSLLTKPFVILTGLSGSGKTRIAQAFAKWICHDKSQYCIIPVGADWTNREPLLGYPNALNQEEYVRPDTGALDLVIHANEHPDLPHFLILDEMNLSHVERYFADFLSAMESQEEILLYPEEHLIDGIPSKLKLPSNLFIIGTVNIDETTNMFSPKVLDRANTIEFRVTEDDMGKFLSEIKEINMEVLTSKGSGTSKSFLDLAQGQPPQSVDITEINDTLVRFFRELKKTGAEFGYRSATEILRLMNILSILDSDMSINDKLDIAIIQKLLPKLHGSRRKLISTLTTLGSFCIEGEIDFEKDIVGKEGFDFSGNNVIYPMSLEKIARMYKGAIENGFASFAEA